MLLDPFTPDPDALSDREREAAGDIVEFLAREKMLPEETTEAVRRQKPSALCPDIL